MKELPATLVLRPFNSDTLAVVAYQLARDERLGEAALPSLALVLVGLVPVMLLSRTLRSAAAKLVNQGSSLHSDGCGGFAEHDLAGGHVHHADFAVAREALGRQADGERAVVHGELLRPAGGPETPGDGLAAFDPVVGDVMEALLLCWSLGGALRPAFILGGRVTLA